MLGGLTNEYVQDLGKKLDKKTFLGVFCSDMKPQTPNNKEFSMIFNLDKCSGKGTHFVAIYCNKNNLFYFDSYGLPCDNLKIKKYISSIKDSRRCFFNTKCIQSYDSVFCGYFCLSFILYMKCYSNQNNFIKLFKKTQLHLNDGIACKMIIDFINNEQNCMKK
jgi:hypothetical protein